MIRFDIFHGENFQAVALPYQDKRLEMVVFLPNKGVDLAAFNASFTADNWQKWMPRFGKHKGHLGLPRFKIEYQKELSTALKEAGMPCAFKDGCADFSEDDERICLNLGGFTQNIHGSERKGNRSRRCHCRRSRCDFSCNRCAAAPLK